jgi:hypothetical protein
VARSRQRRNTQHRVWIERLDRQLAPHLLAAIEQADDRHVFPDAVVGEGQRAPGAFLAATIRHVAGVARHEEMVGVDTASLVAAMADIDSRRDRAVPLAPSQAMRPLRAALEAKRAVSGVVHDTVPDVTARRGVEAGVVGEPLGDRPARLAMYAACVHV